MSADNSVNAVRIGPAEISDLLRAFGDSAWTGLDLRVGDTVVVAGKNGPPPRAETDAQATVDSAAVPAAPADPQASVTPTPPAPTAPVPTPVDAGPVDETGLVAVTAPTVGSFWLAPDPGSPPFVSVGSRVAVGDQLGIVEVMKLMNPVLTEVAGEIVAVVAANADLVEFGQRLFLIRPDE